MIARIKAYLAKHPCLIDDLVFIRDFVCIFICVLLALVLLALIVDSAKPPPSTAKEIPSCRL